MSDEPSNAASEAFCNALDLFTETGAPSEEWLRANLTDDFAYEDRRRGPRFATADAESYPKVVNTIWQTGAAGQPRFEYETLAVRGERFAAVGVELDYGNEMLQNSIRVIGFNPSLSLVQRAVDFDRDDVDGAMAELDRLHSEADAS